MREIFFRAKDLRDKWRYGYYDGSADDPALIDEDNESGAFWIKGETLGQYIGLKDINDKKIFEGDIISIGGDIGQIYWDEKRHQFVRTTQNLHYSYFELSPYAQYEVIGNIYDNPELLEETK